MFLDMKLSISVKPGGPLQSIHNAVRVEGKTMKFLPEITLNHKMNIELSRPGCFLCFHFIYKMLFMLDIDIFTIGTTSKDF